MDMRIPPLIIKIMLESNPLKSVMLVRRLAVLTFACLLRAASLPVMGSSPGQVIRSTAVVTTTTTTTTTNDAPSKTHDDDGRGDSAQLRSSGTSRKGQERSGLPVPYYRRKPLTIEGHPLL